MGAPEGAPEGVFAHAVQLMLPGQQHGRHLAVLVHNLPPPYATLPLLLHGILPLQSACVTGFHCCDSIWLPPCRYGYVVAWVILLMLHAVALSLHLTLACCLLLCQIVVWELLQKTHMSVLGLWTLL